MRNERRLKRAQWAHARSPMAAEVHRHLRAQLAHSDNAFITAYKSAFPSNPIPGRSGSVT